MNRYDCTQNGLDTLAVAVCHDCGAGLCPDHTAVSQHTLTVVRATSWQTPVEAPQRRIRCHTCPAAVIAANEPSSDAMATP